MKTNTRPCIITTTWTGKPTTPCRRLRNNEKLRAGDTFILDYKRPHVGDDVCVLKTEDSSNFWIGKTVAYSRTLNPGINYFRKV